MVYALDPRRARAVRVLCATLIMVAGCAVTGGWVFGIPLLRNGFAGSQPVHPISIFAFVCGAGALVAARRWLARLFSSLTLALGVLSCVLWSLSVDVAMLSSAGGDPGLRMPLRAAAAAVFVGASGLTLARGRASQIFANAAAFIGALSLVSFFYGGHFLLGGTSHIAPLTGLILLLWAAGAVAIRAPSVVIDTTTVISFLLPLAFGAVCLRAARPPYFDFPFALALLATATSFALISTSRISAARLRRSERLYRTIVETSQDAICITDADAKFIFVNDRLASILGYAPEDLMGKDARDFTAPEDHAAAAERAQRRRSGADGTQGDLRLVRRDGSRVPMLSSTTTLRRSDGSVSGLLVMLTDITARAVAETALRESEQRFRGLYEASIIGVGYFSFDGRVVDANDELLRMFRVRRDEVTAWRWADSSHPSSAAADAVAYAELLQTGRCRAYEKEAVRHDGSTFWVLIAAAQVGDGAASNVVFAIDVTERVEARRAVERTLEILRVRLSALEGVASAAGDDTTSRQQSQIELLASRLATLHEEIESFSYSVSHDLRAPLRAIDGFSRELIADYHEQLDARGQDYLARIRAAAERMSRLIDDLIGLSRVARKAIRRETVDVSAIVHDIAADVRGVRFEIAAGLLTFADPGLVRITLENLLGNAIKFSSREPQPCVHVFSSAHGTFTVRDNGTGFDADAAINIFEPFERLHSKDYEGTGIGLAIVHRIITRHGGTIQFESAPGEGATFTFTFGDQPS